MDSIPLPAIELCGKTVSAACVAASRGGRHRARIHWHHDDDLLSLVAMRNRVHDPPSRRVLLE